MNLSNWLTFSRDFSTLSSVLVIYGIQVLVTWPDRFLLWLGQNRVGWSFNPWISTSGLCKDDLGLEPSISDPASPNYPKQLESDLFSQHTVLGFSTMSSTPKICEVEVFLYDPVDSLQVTKAEVNLADWLNPWEVSTSWPWHEFPAIFYNLNCLLLSLLTSKS